MTFDQAWRTVLLQKYATFTGRARRSELWWYALFQFGVILIAEIIDRVILHGLPMLSGIVGLALVIPSIAVVVRRLHDTGRSGWWYLIALVPFIGGLVLLVFCVQPSAPGPNRWGPNPIGLESAAVVI